MHGGVCCPLVINYHCRERIFHDIEEFPRRIARTIAQIDRIYSIYTLYIVFNGQETNVEASRLFRLFSELPTLLLPTLIIRTLNYGLRIFAIYLELYEYSTLS